VEIISNAQGNRVTPSIVAFLDGEKLVGDEAYSQIHKNPAGTIYGAKRLLGRKFDDPEIQQEIKTFPFKVTEKKNSPVIEITDGGETKQIPVEAIVADILAKMKHTAEDFIGEPVKNVVITAPAHFRDEQRQALIDAAGMAKLNVIRIVNEPTAAALAYGFQKSLGKDEEKNVLIFDLGGGTFDVSILTLANGVYEVKTTTGEPHLGGEDFDTRLVEFCVAEFKKKNKLDISDNKRALRRLRTLCEKAKRVLSSSAQSSVEVESLAEGIDFNISITRARFEDMCGDLFKKIIDHVAKAVADSGLDKSKIDEVVMVGGSSRIPKIQQMVSDFFGGKELCKSINPEEAIAYGATVQAAILAGADETKESVVVDILPLSLGIETAKGVMTTLIKRKSPIPTTRAITCSTINNNQENVFIKVYEGERARTRHNRLLGQFELKITPRPRGIPQVEVIFEINSSGILEVKAVDRATNETDQIQIVKLKNRLTKEDIEEMVAAAEAYQTDDTKFKERVGYRAQLFTFIENTKTTIDDPSMAARISPEDLATLNEAIDNAIKWSQDNLETADQKAYDDQIVQLRKVVNPILGKVVGFTFPSADSEGVNPEMMSNLQAFFESKGEGSS